MKQKTNNKMLVLSVIGIIIVVLGHTGGIVDFASRLFPYASFEMPLFIFISGYFYKIENENNLFGKNGYILKKIKKLVIPYFIWNLIYGILVTILRHTGVINFGSDLNVFSFFVQPWLDGHQYILNLASWFLLALFLVNIVYVLLRKLLTKFKMWDDDAMLAIFLLIAAIAVLVRNKYTADALIPLTRTMFFLLFYHFGYYYKTKLEGKYSINNALYFIIVIMLQLLILIIDKKIEYGAYNMIFMSSNPVIPIVASITGILFWVKVAEIIEPALSKSKIIRFIGNNTFDIMMHHLFWIFILNSIILGFATLLHLNGIKLEEYKNTIYIFYIPFGVQFLIIYSISAIAGPTLTKYFYLKLKNKIKEKETKL